MSLKTIFSLFKIAGVVNVLTFARHTEDIFVESTNPLTSIGKKSFNVIIMGRRRADFIETNC